MGNYGDIRGLLSGLIGSDPAEDAAGGGQGYGSYWQGQLDRYNAAARAQGAPELTMEEWLAAGKPPTP